MEMGELVPDQIVINMIIEKVKKFQKIIIFDGFPRNLNQAKVLDESLKKISAGLDHVIFWCRIWNIKGAYKE